MGIGCICPISGRWNVFHGESVRLQVDQDVTAQCSTRVVPITMALFLKYSHGESTRRHIIRLIAVFQVWMHTHT